jgi:ubiquinone/menaquinone biosynthesis C-methylase UbiE
MVGEENGQAFIRPEIFWSEVGLKAGETVVHLGCGAGFYLVPAAKIVGKKGKAIGVDVLTDKLEETEAKATRARVGEIVRVIRSNLEAEQGSTLAEAMADWVLVANILHQSQPRLILAEAQRIAKQAGKIVIIEWKTSDSPLGPPQRVRFSRQEAVEIVEELGLKIAKSFEPSEYHYGLVLEKG